MADEDPEDLAEPEADDAVVDPDADDEEFEAEDGEDFVDEDVVAEVVADDEDDDDDDDDDVDTPARPATDDDEDDDDDVEADLDAILKDRLAAEDDDDEDDDGKPPQPAPTPAGEAEPVLARQDNEFSCPNCFLLVNSAAVVDGECPHCGGMVDVP